MSCVKVAGFQPQPQPSGTHAQSTITAWNGLRSKQLEEMAIIILTVRGLCHLKKCLGANLVREQGKRELCLLNLFGMHSAMLPTKGKKNQNKFSPISHETMSYDVLYKLKQKTDARDSCKVVKGDKDVYLLTTGWASQTSCEVNQQQSTRRALHGASWKPGARDELHIPQRVKSGTTTKKRVR